MEAEIDWYIDDNCTEEDLYFQEPPLSHCQNVSLETLAFLQDASAAYVFIGLLSSIFSCLTVFVILADFQLHSKTYYFIANLGIVDLIASTGLVYCGMKRLIFYSMGQTDVMTQLECLYQEAPIVIGMTGNIVIFVLTAIDRLLAIILPAWYQNHYPRWSYVGQHLFVYSFIAFEVMSLYYGADRDRVISICAYTTASSQNVLFEQSIRAKVLIVATVLMYTFLMFWVQTKVRKARSAGGDRVRATKRELQVRVLITLTCILAAFVFTTILGHVLYTIALSHTSLPWALKFATYSASAMCANSCTNFLIMYCRSKDFRQAVRFHVLRQKSHLSGAVLIVSPRSSAATSTM